MPKGKRTSARVAKIASRLLRSKATSPSTKKVAASTLSQRAPKRKGK
jgi:hypothetical protein